MAHLEALAAGDSVLAPIHGPNGVIMIPALVLSVGAPVWNGPGPDAVRWTPVSVRLDVFGQTIVINRDKLEMAEPQPVTGSRASRLAPPKEF